MSEQMATYIDYEAMSPDQIRQFFSTLPKAPGYCVFIDICNSTQLKDIEIHKWIISIKNTFSWAQSLFPFKILKGIGDELMFYITDEELKWLKENKPVSYFSPLQMLQALHELIKNKEYQEPVKVAICYCEDVYHITFLKDVDDYYGKDIDLTAKLMGDSKKNSIIMNKEFYQTVKSKYDSILNKENFEEIFNNIERLCPKQYKGFREKTDRYLLKCK